MLTIHCRARLTGDCHEGQPETTDEPMADDGTFIADDHRGSIVCNSCYLEILPFTLSGMGLLEELPQAIGHYETTLSHIRASRRPEELVAAAQAAADASAPGSPSMHSAIKCRDMAQAEIERRSEEARELMEESPNER